MPQVSVEERQVRRDKDACGEEVDIPRSVRAASRDLVVSTHHIADAGSGKAAVAKNSQGADQSAGDAAGELGDAPDARNTHRNRHDYVSRIQDHGATASDAAVQRHPVGRHVRQDEVTLRDRPAAEHDSGPRESVHPHPLYSVGLGRSQNVRIERILGSQRPGLARSA